MSDLPPEILLEILTRLPPEDLIRSLCVSKAWNALIHDHRFIKAHLQRSIQTISARTILLGSYDNLPTHFFSLPLDDSETFGTAVEIGQPMESPEDYTFVLGCSVNGVVCIHNQEDGDIALWNPSIQKFKKIPFPTFEIEQQPPSDSDQCGLEIDLKVGVGYDLANDDFKVLGIAGFINGENVTVSYKISVYSLKSKSWRRIQNLPCNGFEMHNNSDIVFSNGAWSWMMHDKLDRCIIKTLDLASEEYRVFDTPVDEDANSAMHLEVLGGSLCISVIHWGSRHDVWIMKDGVAESWSLLYSIDRETVPWPFHACRPLMLSKNGEMVLIKKDDLALLWLDLEKKDLEKENSIEVKIGVFEATICVGSLSLLDGDPVIVGRQR